MKKIVLTIATLSVLAVPISSMADEGSVYIKGNLGIGIGMDTDIDNMPDANGSAEITFDSGFAGSIAVGYDFANPMRMEIEFLHHKNDLEISYFDTIYDTFNDGDLKTHSFMLNGFYDFNTGSPWTPFVGAGLGWSKLVINDPGFHASDSDDVFTYQLTGGLAYAFNEKWTVDAQYRFLGTGDATIDGAEFSHNSNDLMLGLRYSF